MVQRANRRVTALLTAIAIAVGVSVGLSGCSLFGVGKAKQMQTDLANQRKVAVKFVEEYPNPALEVIEYTDRGSVDGSGSWGANAIVTVAGRKYNEILGTFMSIGDGLPSIAPDAPGATGVTVIYSDGTSEVFQ
ncbi:hypothetical protein GCM10027406_36190 [Leifsonia lichenia]